MIYLNAAGHGLPDRAVRDRMRAYLDREDDIGPAAADAEAAEEMASVRGKCARLVGASEDEIALPPTTSAGWNAAAQCLSLSGRRVLVAPGEWSSDVAMLDRLGAQIEVMPTGADGALDLPAIAARIDDDLGAICAPLVSSLTGERYPLEKIGALARPETCVFLIDAAQALGQMPVDVTALNCDVLAATTRKWLRGPRNTALLYVRRSLLDRMRPNMSIEYGGLVFDEGRFSDIPSVRRFEPSGVLVPQRLGQGVALDLFDASVFEVLARRANEVRSRAMSAGFELAGAEPERSAIVTLKGPAARISEVQRRLTAAEIQGKHTNPDCEPMRAPATVDGGFLRISVHVYNTDAELDRLYEVLDSF